ncbi:UBX domain-containing protein 10 [Megalops cyprinoides]|uniref:UBX domain-containing protein 10 n=1 Tax=Megalops cyprinoides TaxID=118141 RepID=UPI001864CADE|nr:UBX domain-containing protein 10 [Megalops cyprinoides]
MHVTRPKSSKGRCRPTLSHAKSADVSGYRNPPVTPRPPSVGPDRPDRSARSHPLLRQSSVMSTDEVAELLQNVPPPPALSLNRYRVLPSIERKPLEDEAFRRMEEKTSRLSLSDNLIVQARRGHREQHLTFFRTRAASQSSTEIASSSVVPNRKTPHPPGPGGEPAEAGILTAAPSGDQLSLLLAIRSPCGKRFQHHFLPTDTLQAVLAAAEVRHGAKYGRGVIETMEVPRRSFTDLSMTLAQCGIQNRSVLCISKEEDGSTDSA